LLIVGLVEVHGDAQQHQHHSTRYADCDDHGRAIMSCVVGSVTPRY
jgi:hypothetical protein